MDDESDIVGFAEDPNLSLVPVEKELVVWVGKDEKVVIVELGDDNLRYFSSACAQGFVTGLERGAIDTELEQKTEQEDAMLQRTADRVEDLQ